MKTICSSLQNAGVFAKGHWDQAGTPRRHESSGPSPRIRETPMIQTSGQTQPNLYSLATPTNGPGQIGADELHAKGRDLAPSQGNFARLPWLRTFPVMS
jgi:hypothetical protein